ncbi:MAG: rhodanese-like domain-containing protein [Burkholderiaceae bacterium]
MPASLASQGALVHPHQMEIQDFSLYALVIDARRPEAFLDDHIPGAVSVPVPSAGGSCLSSSADTPAPMSVAERGLAMPYELADRIKPLSRDDLVLVYCDRGGLDSEAWASPLRRAGFRVDVLGGGWGNYRKWVDAGLTVLPRALRFRRLLAPPVSGLCCFLGVLAKQGQQVLDISELAGQHLVPGLTLRADSAPSQAAFDTQLLDRLRRFDPELPIWVRSGPAPLDGLVLPAALRDAIERCESVRLEVPLAERARAWLDRTQAMQTSVSSLIEAFSASALPPSRTQVQQWDSLDAAGRTLESLAAIIDGYIDPNNKVQNMQQPCRVVRMPSLDLEAVVAMVRDWLGTGPAAAPAA